jgi:sec-independent protein translocase protein TatA
MTWRVKSGSKDSDVREYSQMQKTAEIDRGLAMFGLGTTELIILAGILFLLFGASKLPQLGAGIGQGIRNFKKSMKEPDAIDVTPKKDEAKKDDEKNS